MAENLDGFSVSIKTSQSDICSLQPHSSITFSSPVFKGSYHGWAESTEVQMIYMERKKIPCFHSRPDSALHFYAPSVAPFGVHLWWGLNWSPWTWGHSHHPCPQGRGSQLCPGHSAGLHHSKSWECVLVPPVLSHTTHKCSFLVDMNL